MRRSHALSGCLLNCLLRPRIRGKHFRPNAPRVRRTGAAVRGQRVGAGDYSSRCRRLPRNSQRSKGGSTAEEMSTPGSPATTSPCCMSPARSDSCGWTCARRRNGPLLPPSLHCCTFSAAARRCWSAFRSHARDSVPSPQGPRTWEAAVAAAQHGQCGEQHGQSDGVLPTSTHVSKAGREHVAGDR